MAEFGTLFTRADNAATRAHASAYFTNQADILLIVEPVLMEPLRREWAAFQIEMTADPATVDRCIRAMLDRLRTITVLDPACGTGNFLYVALQELKKLEREVLAYAWGLRWHPPRT
jgi:type I restriction-modification system DNA methylase subunit